MRRRVSGRRARRRPGRSTPSPRRSPRCPTTPWPPTPRRPRLRRLGGPVRRRPSPAEVKRTTCRRYLAYLTTREYARRSVARKVAALRRYFAWLVAPGRSTPIRRSACRPAAATGGCRACSTRRELDELLDGATARGRAGLAAPPRRRGARGAVRPGLRVSELCGLDVGSHRPRSRRRSSVWGKGAKQRRVPLSGPAVRGARGVAGASATRSSPTSRSSGAGAVRQRAGPPR